jgi:hypothetical protein
MGSVYRLHYAKRVSSCRNGNRRAAINLENTSLYCSSQYRKPDHIVEREHVVLFELVTKRQPNHRRILREVPPQLRQRLGIGRYADIGAAVQTRAD